MVKHLTGSEHHIAAAEQYERAARHHRCASQHYLEMNHPQAAYQALIAHGHMQQAVRHSSEATKYYVELNGQEVVPEPKRVATKPAILLDKARARPKRA
jgi:hypothetical protein